MAPAVEEALSRSGLRRDDRRLHAGTGAPTSGSGSRTSSTGTGRGSCGSASSAAVIVLVGLVLAARALRLAAPRAAGPGRDGPHRHRRTARSRGSGTKRTTSLPAPDPPWRSRDCLPLSRGRTRQPHRRRSHHRARRLHRRRRREGSGKTTLCKTFNGLIAHFWSGTYSGSVRVFGQDTTTTNVASLSHQVGYVYQDFGNQLVRPTVYDEVSFGPVNFGLTDWRNAPTKHWTCWESPPCATTTPGSSPAANSTWWRWPVSWRCGPAWSWWTNRWPSWTRSAPRRSIAASPTSTGGWGRRWS